MLSTIAEGRREFIHEQRRRRDRNNSEPSHAHYLSDTVPHTHADPVSLTPLNSPTKTSALSKNSVILISDTNNFVYASK